ncbi:MAG: peptide deformylase [Polyangia bacterium]
MALRKIVRFPNPFLRQPTREVQGIDKAVRTLIDDMMETMCDVNGAGLAAIQVGASERIFIIEATAAGGEPTDQPKVFINPKLELFSSETDVKDEGCLSFPSIFIPVKRSLKVRVSALDIDGNPFTLDTEDFYARAIQHEHDHLINKLLFDYAGPLKKQMIKRKLDKMTDEEAYELLARHGD